MDRAAQPELRGLYGLSGRHGCCCVAAAHAGRPKSFPGDVAVGGDCLLPGVCLFPSHRRRTG